VNIYMRMIAEIHAWTHRRMGWPPPSPQERDDIIVKEINLVVNRIDFVEDGVYAIMVNGFISQAAAERLKESLRTVVLGTPRVSFVVMEDGCKVRRIY